MFTATLFTTAKKWNQPSCPSTDEWILKMGYIHIIEFYSLKRKKMKLPGKWMEMEKMTLSEVTQAQKTDITCSPCVNPNLKSLILYAHLGVPIEARREEECLKGGRIAEQK